MKIRAERKSFTTAVVNAARAVPHRSTLPILGHAMLDSGGDSGNPFLRVTNLEAYGMLWFHGAVTGKGLRTLPIKALASVLKRMTESIVTLDMEGDGAIIECGGLRVEFTKLLDTDEFPAGGEAEDARTWATMDPKLFRQMVSEAVPFVAPDESRPVLHQIVFDIQDSTVQSMAADGFMMIRQRYALKGASGAFAFGLKPAHAVLLSKVLAPKEPVTFGPAVSPGGVEMVKVADGCSRWYINKAYDGPGNFPDASRVIPKSAELSLRVNREEILGAAQASAGFGKFFADQDFPIFRLRYAPGRDSQEPSLTSRVEASGDAEGSVSWSAQRLVASGLTEQERPVAVDAKRFARLLSTIDAPEVEVWVAGVASPVAVLSHGVDIKDSVRVLMPMHVAR